MDQLNSLRYNSQWAIGDLQVLKPCQCMRCYGQWDILGLLIWEVICAGCRPWCSKGFFLNGGTIAFCLVQDPTSICNNMLFPPCCCDTSTMASPLSLASVARVTYIETGKRKDCGCSKHCLHLVKCCLTITIPVNRTTHRFKLKRGSAMV